jgi:hypothetical protein
VLILTLEDRLRLIPVRVQLYIVRFRVILVTVICIPLILFVDIAPRGVGTYAILT